MIREIKPASEQQFTEIEEYLYASKQLFWNGIREMMDYRPKISGYTTTFNCVQQKYPFIQCIKSMLEFCDEVCVVDGGSKDGTLEELVKLAWEYSDSPQMLSEAHPDHAKLMIENGTDYLRDPSIATNVTGSFGPFCDHKCPGRGCHSRVRINVVKRDWKHPRFAVFDGMQKAEARKMCVGDYCWQMDSDEIVHEEDAPKIVDLCRLLPKDIDILSLPVTEYWGSSDKVRCDVQPWKWRLSRNKPNITHGIPVHLRKQDDQGNLCAAEGTDGCDMIDANTGLPIPHVGFYTQEAENARRAALQGNPQALQEYERWFNEVVNNLPGVFHYSWYDLPRKISLYRDYWQSHWRSLYNMKIEDTPENNMMFDTAWKDVTDEMLVERANLMKEKLGGWIWHRKWDGKTTTPHINVTRSQPKVMK